MATPLRTGLHPCIEATAVLRHRGPSRPELAIDGMRWSVQEQLIEG